MTTWPQDADDEYEFYDPTAPAASPASEPFAPQGDPDIPPGALSDQTGSVHAWFDDDHHLRDLRLSNRWRERLRGESSLQEAVWSVIGGVAVAGAGAQWSPPATPHPPAPLSDAALDRLMERSLAADEAARVLTDRGDARPTRWRGEPTVGHSANRQVSLTLAPTGRPSALSLDQEWAEQARAEAIAAAVVQAYRDAQLHWQEPAVEPGEWDLLAAERRDIRDEILALFKHGI